MNPEQLKRLIREHYPFPIAHAHKKTLGVLDNDSEKLKCLLETAEVTIQFLALLTLAQVRQDLLNRSSGSHPPAPLKGGIHACAPRGETHLSQEGNIGGSIETEVPGQVCSGSAGAGGRDRR